MAEACVPAINTVDIGSIFEEHHICKNLSTLIQARKNRPGAAYSEDEGRFSFGSVVVGNRVEARFRISNTSKVILALKSRKNCYKKITLFICEQMCAELFD